MPKPLSLKKSLQSGPPKNQKSITQFFKHANPFLSQNSQKSPDKSIISHTNGVETKALKRKAISPTVPEIIEIDEDPGASIGTTTNCVQKNSFHTPKKFKSELSPPIEFLNKSKKAPQKENFVQYKSTFKKNHLNINSTSKEHLEENASEIDELCKKDRSPLSPIKICLNGESEVANDKVNYMNSFESGGNHINQRKQTPKKVLQFDDVGRKEGSDFKEKSPMKSPAKCLLNRLLETPEKLSKDELSPSKCGSTLKTLEVSPGALDDFGDQWDLDQIDDECKEDLDLSSMQRCEVVSVTRQHGATELRLKNHDNLRATCFLEGVWLDTPVSPGEILSIIATRNGSGQFYVNSSSGLVSLRPDHLVSSTSVVAGVFCQRKAVLQERFRGLDAGNTAMTIGILIHELVQKALTQHMMDTTQLRTETDRIIKESLQMLYDAGIEEDEARNNMKIYIQPLADFMQTYVANSPLSKPPQKDQWAGHIDKVLDIEENLCCPQLGLKGKIDATLQVTIHEQKGRERAIVPLELKSGKASMSAEHRGQLVLYGMMLALCRQEHPATAQMRGLLLYLKERVELREVKCGYPERRDLLMLRNQLVQYLANSSQDIDPEQLTDIEDASCFLQQKLPEPVHHHSACAKCPYLTTCSLHLWHTDGPSVSDDHPLSKLRDQALGHLTSQHIEYFLHWAALLRAEERGQSAAAPLHALWTDSAEKRAKRGTCAANLKLKSVEPSGDRYLHVFERKIKAIDSLSNKTVSGPQEGEFSIVSIGGRPWIAAGVVTLAKEKDITIILERDLSRQHNKDVTFHIDTYEAYATTVHNLTNLGVLLEDSENSERLRKLIIDKEAPEFENKLPREVGRLGSKLMRSLNIEQQRAVLKALAAKHYALLRGLPGTGKTQTTSVLIQMLVGLKRRVLVTAHTHSAVDTVLSRLPESLKVMRLGSSGRVAQSLVHRCEEQLVAKCENVKHLEQLYESMEVVGVTCLGAAHTMLTRTTFDVCIVDEATQVLQSTVLRPLFAARTFVLVGDPDQLPPVVRSRAARRLGMEESLFHRLMSEEATSTLRLQYRMNRPLADIANKVAYNSRLKCADHTVANAMLDVDVQKLSHLSSWLLSACSPKPDQAALFLDTSSIETREATSKTCTNVNEACVSMALVEALIMGGVKSSDIGIIAPYRDQVSLLRRVLSPRGVECSTVDQFQGRDKSVILYCCTKHTENDDRKVKEGEILNDQRRLAVSVTRAKHKLVVIGDSRALQRYLPLQKLIQSCTTLVLNKNDLEAVVDKYKNQFI